MLINSPTPSGPLKVLIIDPANFVGGAELFTIDLLKNITPRYSDIQVDVVFNGNPEYKKLIPPEINTFILPFPKLKNTGIKGIYNFYKSSKDLRELIENGNYDIVQTNSVRTHLTGSLALRKSKTKLFWFMHDFTAPPRITRLFSKTPKHIFCCSEAVSNYVSSHISKNLEEKISIIPNGIEMKERPPLNVSENPFPKIGMIGRIDEWKGQKYFILAAIEVLKKHPEARFYIIGAPNKYDVKTVAYFSELKFLVKEHHLEDKIILTGFKEDILNEIAQLDIVVHSSIEKEPFGRVIIEAMSLKKPVIATNIGGPLEIIDHQKNGILVTPKDIPSLSDSIQNLLENKEFSQKLGEEAYKTVERSFSLDKICDKIVMTWYKNL